MGHVRFTCPVRHQHRGEVYGFRFQTGRSQKSEARMQNAEVRLSKGQGDKGIEGQSAQALDPLIPRFLDPFLSVSYIADTRYFPELAEFYRADVVIMNVVRPSASELDHLSAPDAGELVKAMRPRLTVLTHFGMRMLSAKPWVIAREMSERTGCKVVAASDGMLLDLDEVKVESTKSQIPNPTAGWS